MTMIKLKSVIEFLFWIVLFVLVLAYFNKSWNLSFYFIIGALLFVLLVIEILLNLKHRYKQIKKGKIIKKEHIKKVKSEKRIKKKHMRYGKNKFYRELTSLFSFIVVLIIMFSLVIQKKKFLEFFSFRHYHLYFILALVIVAFIIMILYFIEHMQSRRKEKFEFITKMKYDFIFLFGLIVVIVAYIFKNWITALLGLILMVISLVVYKFNVKKIALLKETSPKKIISKKIQKDQKLRLLLESPIGMITEIKRKEEKAKQETHTEKLKLKELQRKIKEELKRKKEEERLRKKQEKLERANEIARQKKIEIERRKLEKIKKSKEKILTKEKKLGKIQKNREEIENIIKTKKGLKQKAKYETDFDVLLALLAKYEKLKLSDVAKIFGIDTKKAEIWATILEQHNLLEIHYPAIGEPELKIKK